MATARWELSLTSEVLEHVERAAGADAVLYLGSVALWLAGVVVFIVLKLRAA